MRVALQTVAERMVAGATLVSDRIVKDQGGKSELPRVSLPDRLAQFPVFLPHARVGRRRACEARQTRADGDPRELTAEGAEVRRGREARRS
jgi:hypothetical protein